MSHQLIRAARHRALRKAQPAQGDVFVSAPLTTMSVAYQQTADSFIAARVFPVVQVELQGGKFWVWNRSDFMRDEARVRADGTESAGGGFNLTTSPYQCAVYAYHKDIGDQTRANSRTINLDQAATNFVTRKQLIRRERSWFGSFFTTGVWSTDVTGVASGPSGAQVLRWDVAAATPAVDVDLYKATMLNATGYLPNKLVLGYQVFAALRNNADVRDRTKYTSPESVDEVMLAKYFGVGEVVVSKAVYDSAHEGATSAMGLIAGKQALLCYAAPSASIMDISAGYTFAWSGYPGGGYEAPVMSKFRMDHLKADRVEAEMAYQQSVIATDLGVFFATLVS